MSETSEQVRFKTLRQIVAEVAPTMQCNCDLDNWEPEIDSGHSWVCRIHKKATTLYALEKQKARQFLLMNGELL